MTFKRGVPLSEEHKKKIGDFFRGKPLSEETKRKISETRKRLGFSEKAIRLNREKHLGKKNGMWKGDRAGEKSAHERAIRAFPCSENKERHHIDGNPWNNDPSNIDFLTRKEHMIKDGRLDRFIKNNIDKRGKIDKINKIEFMELYNNHISDERIGMFFHVAETTIKRFRIRNNLPPNGPLRREK